MDSASPNPPPGLAARGSRMWEQSVAAWQLTPAHLVLLEEACRVADRLELLDRLIRGFVDRIGVPSDEGEGDSGGPPDIAGLLAEARAHQTALKGLLAELRQGQRTVGGQAGSPAVAGGAAGGSGVSDLSARIAARRGQAQG